MNRKKNIRIIGGGFCGLATAWKLQNSGHQVTIYNDNELGCSASAISAGLLHCYTGPQAKIPHLGREGFKATLELIAIAEEALGQSVSSRSGLLRLALSKSQKKNFFDCAQNNDDVEWWDSIECQDHYPRIAEASGIFIANAYRVDTKKYLKGLWNACQKLGATWTQEKVATLEPSSHYDMTIVTAGPFTKLISPLEDLKLTPVKGQLLEIEWPSEVPAPCAPISSQAYIVPIEKTNRFIVGATFEHEFIDESSDVDVALTTLLPKLSAIYPEIQQPKIINCYSGIRASTPTRLPILQQVNDRTWVLAGMGSKGLLWHAIYADMLCDKYSNLN